jgi:hypothetical protein
LLPSEIRPFGAAAPPAPPELEATLAGALVAARITAAAMPRGTPAFRHERQRSRMNMIPPIDGNENRRCDA